MMWQFTALALLAAAGMSASAGAPLKERLLSGEIQFLAHQQKYLEALQRIDSLDLVARQKLQQQLQQRKHKLQQQQDEAADEVLTLADIELGYRMSQRAGRAIRAALDTDTDQAQRNRAAWRLANLYYDKARYRKAGFALQLIRGDVFYPFNHDIEYLRAKINIRLGEYDAAIAALQKLQYDDRFNGFATFNLGHALIAAGRIDEGTQKLAEAGAMQAHDEVLRALRDKANLVLGYRALHDREPQQALRYLRRVRTTGAFSDKALLGIGWAAMTQQQYRLALAAWSELVARDHTRAAVQEAMLALAYTWGKLDALSMAAQSYQHAISAYETALSQIDASMKTIESGQWFDRLRDAALPATDAGISRLRMLPEMSYLPELLAQPAFRRAILDFLELEQLSRHLTASMHSILALQALVEHRQQFAQQAGGQFTADLQSASSKLATLQRKRDTLAKPVAAVSSGGHQDGRQQMLRSLDAMISDLQQRHDRLEQRLQRLAQVGGYRVPLFTLGQAFDAVREKLHLLHRQQQKTVQTMMLDALQHSRQRLQRYLATARYELAKTYDVSADRNRRQPVTDESAVAP